MYLNPTSFSSSNLKVFIHLTFTIMSCLTGILLLSLGIWTGWIFFGLSISAALLYRPSNPSKLAITFGGISILQHGRTSSFKWSDIEEFLIERDKSKKLVVIRLSRTAVERGIENNIYLRRITGPTGDSRYFIPDNFGYKAEELKARLAQWQKR